STQVGRAPADSAEFQELIRVAGLINEAVLKCGILRQIGAVAAALNVAPAPKAPLLRARLSADVGLNHVMSENSISLNLNDRWGWRAGQRNRPRDDVTQRYIAENRLVTSA